MKKKRVEITFKRERTVAIKANSLTVALCEECGRQVQMVRPGQAAILTRISAREVYHLVDAGEIHFLETAEGLLLICLDSLSERRPLQGQILIEAAHADQPAPRTDATSSDEPEPN